VSVFDHDVAPLYLRTKPDPEIDEKVTLLVEKSNKISGENLLVFSTTHYFVINH